MNRLIKYGAPVAILGLGFLGVATLFATKPEPEKVEQEVRPLSVFVEDVRQEPVTLKVKAQGEVRPKTEIQLVPQVSGRVVFVSPAFEAGGTINRGDVLIQIEDTDYRTAVTQAEAEVAAAELTLAKEVAGAEIVAKQWKWEKLEKDEPTELGLRRPQVAAARSKVRAAKASLDSAKLNLARTKLIAPFNGHVRKKNTDIGSVVSVGQNLGTIFSSEKVEIRLPLTDAQMGQLGLSVAYNAENAHSAPQVELSARVGGMQRKWMGYIARTEAALDESTRLYFAIAEVEDPYGAAAVNGAPLAIGLFVNAEIAGQTLDSAYIIPRAALRPNNKVYVVEEDETLSVRNVEVFSSDASRAILASGVSKGEQVVISPISDPKEGMAVAAARRDEAAQLATLDAQAKGAGL
ncbi:MAG: efflux RND transporter periplasmic adaptor subunit [Sphingomonadales bacterium]